MTRGEQFAGLTVALVTPFKNGDIDFAGLQKLVDWHIEEGTDCLAPVGTTGESPTLDHQEHERVISAVVEQARGRIKVMPGTGSNSTREAIRLTKFAKRAGADGVLSVGPYYNKPTQEGYYRHFAAIAEAVDIPIVLYNIPGRTGSNILPETIARIAEKCPQLVAVKEATGSLDQASQVAALCDVTILSGDDSLTLPLMSIGGRGVISVVGNIVPRDMKALVKAFDAGNIAEAQALAPQALSALPRHVERGHESDSTQGGNGPPRPRQRRDAPADVPARRSRPRKGAQNAGAVRAAVRQFAVEAAIMSIRIRVRNLAILAAVLVGGLASVLHAAEPARPSPKLDLYGDPLPDGAVARMGSIRFRHAGLSDIAWSADGKSITTMATMA